jgi:hypothetical protein
MNQLKSATTAANAEHAAFTLEHLDIKMAGSATFQRLDPYEFAQMHRSTRIFTLQALTNHHKTMLVSLAHNGACKHRCQ